MFISKLSAIASIACVLLVLPAQAGAQRINSIKGTPSANAEGRVTLAGQVRDQDGRPLGAAEIIVDDEHRAISNSRGEFSIPGLTPGLLQFTARRIGYTPVVTGIRVDPGVTVQLSVKLVPAAIELGTMIVEGKRLDKTLWQTGFYQRQNVGLGTYFDNVYLSHFQASLANLVGNIASVTVDRSSNGAAVAYGKLPNGGSCPLSVFLDGNYIPWATDSGLDNVINRDEVLAIEVYPRASDVPATIAGKGGMSGVGSIGTVNVRGQQMQAGQVYAECGAILMWTKPIQKKN
jgi:hypothetical protein